MFIIVICSFFLELLKKLNKHRQLNWKVGYPLFQCRSTEEQKFLSSRVKSQKSKEQNSEDQKSSSAETGSLFVHFALVKGAREDGVRVSFYVFSLPASTERSSVQQYVQAGLLARPETLSRQDAFSYVFQNSQ
jgi:hypothetical protein